MMEYFGYKVRIATKYHAVLYKKFEHEDIFINQVMKISLAKDEYAANVELGIADTYINQQVLDLLQIALNRTKKDLREYGQTIIKKMKESWKLV